MTQDQAEKMAISALGWMANDVDVMGQFLGWSGASVDDLKHIAQAPEMLLAVIDFILLQDEWVIAASEEIGLPPEKFRTIREALPGGQETHWT